MQQAETEVTAQAIMDTFKIVPTASVYWKSSIRTFTREDVERMATSLRVHGQFHPLVVTPARNDNLTRINATENLVDVYEGVTGRLRYEGAKHAMIPEVLVRIHAFEDEDEMLEWQLSENLHRKELNAIEKASAYARLAELRRRRFPNEQTVVAGIAMTIEATTGTKLAAKTVQKYLQINRKIGEAHSIAHRVSKENVGIRHLEQICRIKDQNKQAELLLNTARNRWTVGKLKSEVDHTLGVAKPKPQSVATGLKVLCPRCLETYELFHAKHGRHQLRKVKEDPYARALIKTRDALTTKQFNLTGFKDTMKHFGAQNTEAIEKLFWQQVREKQIRSVGGGFFRYKIKEEV